EASVVCFSPEGGRVATVVNTMTLEYFGPVVWDADTGKYLLRLASPVKAIAMSFSPDGSRLATASSDGTTQLWDAHTGRQWWTFRGHPAAAWSVVSGAAGARLATTATDGTARVWDARTGQEVLVLQAGEKRKFLVGRRRSEGASVAFSPDGTRLATAS